MKIYTFNPETNTHLWMTVPSEWSMNDVDFFLKGKPHLELRGKPEESKADVIVAEPQSPVVAVPAPEPVTVIAATPIPLEDPRPEPEAEGEPKENKRPEGLPCCPYHPNYTGMRIRRTALECEGCQEVYKARQALGIKETRVSKGPRKSRVNAL